MDRRPQSEAIGEGSGAFQFQDPAEATGKTLTVWYHRPRGFGVGTPIVILLHGSDRAASYFRDCWRGHAERCNLLVIAPEFDSEAFPGGEFYNYGNVKASKEEAGAINPRRLWTYGIIDRIFERARSLACSQRTTFCLFGHSAGAQFAHRYIALTGAPAVDLTVAANAGWYMLPRHDRPFPGGFGGLDVDDGTLRRFFARRLTLLLGEADTDEQDTGLAQFPDAVALGPHRLARGRRYFELCRDEAARMGADFGWRLVTAPGVGHEDDQVAGPAAEVIAAHVAGRGDEQA